jgi:predicted O-linked N-acetylglucosamine transferase (SPINDLY family)
MVKLPRQKQRKSPAKKIPPITEISAQADALATKGDLQGAIRLWQDWLKQTQSPLAWAANFNLGVLLRNTGDVAGAMSAYRAAIQQNPACAHARVNLGTLLESHGQASAAIEEWQAALKHLDVGPNADPALLCAVLNNLGRTLETLYRYADASAMLTRSLALRPEQEAVLYHWIYLRQKQCEWPIYGSLPGITTEQMIRATSAIAMLSISDDPALQLQTALDHVPGKPLIDPPRLAPLNGYAHERLRIGYLSSNFGMHAVSILTAELYELHDRSRVEVYGFCWSPEDNTEMRIRVRNAMDHFVRINEMSDTAAAEAIRAAEIDVLIDLQGLTGGCRPNILAYRPAPVQITWLGFPGPTGLPGIDYVLSDKYVIPEETAQHYTEKPLYMPECYQVNDRKRESAPPLSRKEYQLPEDAFVFCAFNNNIKFTPEFFSAWMRILNRVPHSVLWLLADNERAKANLLRYAEAMAITSERLIFAPRVPVAEYLGRFVAADLFLDLSPFNGGTTAADALWMGLPLITCSGRSFASRMAGSLLRSIGLPELVTTSLADYEDLAVRLANTPDLLLEYKQRLNANKLSSPVFDTPRFVRDLEDVLFAVAASPVEDPAANSATASPDSLNG